MRDWGHYRKLYESLPPAFERLPYAARCLAAELIRRADKKGRVVPGETLSDSVVSDLAFHVRAHTGEEEFLLRSLGVLLTDGYLVFRDGYLLIRNFAEAQRSEAADRMARMRARGDAPPEPRSERDEQLNSDAGYVTSREGEEGGKGGGVGGSSSRLVSSRSDSAKPAIPSKPGSARVRLSASESIPVECPADLEPTDSQAEALAAKHGCTAARVKQVAPEVRWYWREGPGKGKRKTLRGWAQTFGNRVDQLARSGTLYTAPGAVPVAAAPENDQAAARAKAAEVEARMKARREAERGAQ